MQILPPRKPSFGAAFYTDRRRRMPLEKPAAVAAGPVESAKRNELTAGRARSPPRVRGTAQRTAIRASPAGIIPARAGSRWRWTSRTAPSRDHLRACGEQVSTFIRLPLDPGSSPRMRGAVDAPVDDRSRLRIIPACAGNSH